MYTPYVSWRVVPKLPRLSRLLTHHGRPRRSAQIHLPCISLGRGRPGFPAALSLLPRSPSLAPPGASRTCTSRVPPLGATEQEPRSRKQHTRRATRASDLKTPGDAGLRGRSSLQPSGLGPPNPIGGAGVVVDGAQRHRRRRPHDAAARQQREEPPLDRVDQLVPPARCGVVWCGVVWCGVVWCKQARGALAFRWLMR